MTESGIPEEAPCEVPLSADEDVAKLRLQLKDLSLEELEEKGLVRWDKKENVVKKGKNFGKKNTE